MSMDDQELASLRRAFAAHSQPTPDPAVCPPPEKIWDAVRGDLPADELREIIEHTARCTACAEDWRLACNLQNKEVAAAPAPPLRVAPRRNLLRNWGLAAAAALALGVVGVQWYQKQAAPPAAEYREGRQAAIRSRVREDQALPRERFVLKWSAPVAAEASYGLQVSTEDLRVVATAEGLKAQEYRVPASALAGLPTGSKLLWRVDADLPDGSRLTSPTFVARVQ